MINLIKASCADQEVDIVVNAANKNLLGGSGICGVIFNKAGNKELQAACNEYKRPLKDGEVAITPSFNMKDCKYIIHAVGPDFRVTPKAFKELYDAYYNSLLKLKEYNLHSISFPLISSGIFAGNLSNPVKTSTNACIDAYNDFIKENKDYDVKVLLCAYTENEYDEANKLFQDTEKTFYENISNWDFSMIKYEEGYLTDWDFYKLIKESSTPESIILDLGTAGGEKVINNFPKVKKIIGTDFSPKMIETANNNLKESKKDYIEFKVMDNLNMTTEDNYFDIVVARHTCIDAKGIYKTLKNGGKLFLRGVDKLDCWSLKHLFNKGQAYNDPKPISLIDYEDIINAGFKNVELVPIHVREYYKTKEDLLALLLKTPILCDFSETGLSTNDNSIDMNLLDKYIEENTTDKGILLIRRYYGITAQKKN